MMVFSIVNSFQQRCRYTSCSQCQALQVSKKNLQPLTSAYVKIKPVNGSIFFKKTLTAQQRDGNVAEKFTLCKYHQSNASLVLLPTKCRITIFSSWQKATTPGNHSKNHAPTASLWNALIMTNANISTGFHMHFGRENTIQFICAVQLFRTWLSVMSKNHSKEACSLQLNVQNTTEKRLFGCAFLPNTNAQQRNYCASNYKFTVSSCTQYFFIKIHPLKIINMSKTHHAIDGDLAQYNLTSVQRLSCIDVYELNRKDIKSALVLAEHFEDYNATSNLDKMLTLKIS